MKKLSEKIEFFRLDFFSRVSHAKWRVSSVYLTLDKEIYLGRANLLIVKIYSNGNSSRVFVYEDSGKILGSLRDTAWRIDRPSEGSSAESNDSSIMAL